MLKRISVLLTACAACLLTPGLVLAQSGRAPTPLSGLLPTLHRAVVAAEDQAFAPLTSTEPEDIRKARQDTVLHTNNLFAAQLSSFPLGSSAGGLTWTFQPVTGTFNRARACSNARLVIWVPTTPPVSSPLCLRWRAMT